MHYYMLAALLNAALATGQRHAVFAGRRLQQWRQTGGDRPNYLHMLAGSGVLPRRVWTRQADDQQHTTTRRRRRFPTSNASPVMGHWRALHDKLDVQSMWPGTAKYANENYLPATTVSYITAVRHNATHISYYPTICITIIYVLSI